MPSDPSTGSPGPSRPRPAWQRFVIRFFAWTFGIALALVILVLLFTLALSIVLNARRRNTPLELSGVPAPSADVSTPS